MDIHPFGALNKIITLNDGDFNLKKYDA